MRCLLMRNLLTFSTKKSHMSRYLKSSLLISLYKFIHQDARRLLMSNLFVKKVSMLLMSRHLMSSNLKKKMRWLLMRCLLTCTWTGLICLYDFFFRETEQPIRPYYLGYLQPSVGHSTFRVISTFSQHSK